MASLLERCAWHEAGHSVCGRILKFEAGGASIQADGTGSASVASAVSLHWDITHHLCAGAQPAAHIGAAGRICDHTRAADQGWQTKSECFGANTVTVAISFMASL